MGTCLHYILSRFENGLTSNFVFKENCLVQNLQLYTDNKFIKLNCKL